MTGKSEPGSHARRSLLRRALAAGAAVLIGAQTRRADAQEVQVLIDNFSFSPSAIITSAGSTVNWLNEDDIPHSIVCTALGVKSDALDTDDRFQYRFERAGTYDYVCGLHPHMRGQVVVV